jgi:hypothetical protein
MTEDHASGYEPGMWMIVFHRTTGKPWIDRLVPGEFKHVSAIGWIEPAKAWLFYDVARLRTWIRVIPEPQGLDYAAKVMAGNEVLQVTPGEQGNWFRFGLYCVPAIKHLLGLRSGALRPTALWRDLAADEFIARTTAAARPVA